MSSEALRIALVGVPNSGKTALFNRLTGAQQKVANYAGVTVERKEGRFSGAHGREYRLLDLPAQIEQALREKVITRAEAERLRRYDAKVMEIVHVDDFDPEELQAGLQPI